MEFDGRQMLRILDSEIIQLNEYIRKPEEDSVIYLSFRYMCEESGTLKVGFDGTDEESDLIVKEFAISANTEYKIFEISGLWDGQGDFTLSFSGDIYIDLLTLANKPLEDYKKTVSTLFEQTDEYIKAVAKEVNNLENYVKEAGWITTADGNKLWATIERVDVLGNRLTTHESSFHVTATEINGIVSRVNTVENRINTAGWITTADGNKLWATQETLNELTKEYNNFKSEITQQADTLSLSIKKGTGTMLYKDVEFKEGLNSVKVYSNSTMKTTVERVNKSSDCPTASSWMLKLAFTYGTDITPGLGGFNFGNATRANAVFETHILAKIPVGYTLTFASNAYGDGSSYKWLTSNEGTGKWETYICRVQCGTSGTFSTTNYYYLNGTKPTVQYSTNGTTWYNYFVSGAIYFRMQNANGTWGSTVNLNSSPDYNKLIWYVGSATVYDLSQYEDVVSQINLSPHNVLIKADRINLEGYVTATNISSINITTSRLTVLDGAKIGQFSVDNNTLYWDYGSAKVRLGYASSYNNASIFAQADYFGHAIVGICNNGGAAIYGSCRATPSYPSSYVLWAGFFDGNVSVNNANLFCEGGVVQAKEVYSLNGWSGSFKGKSVQVKWGIITNVW
ncbi:MAG: hypothetical protein LIP05_08450 [Tannerellaceae bacterium]|nr:hypothetical protein [Tannerellaceae bacterium]